MNSAFDPVAQLAARLRAAQYANPNLDDEELLAAQISRLDAEIRDELRDSVRAFLEAMVVEARRQLSEIAPGHFLIAPEPEPEPLPIDTSPAGQLSAEINRQYDMLNADIPRPQAARIRVQIARIEAELEQLTGERPRFSIAEAEQHFAEVLAAHRRRDLIPAFSHMQNTRGTFVPRKRVVETELLSHPQDRELAARKATRAAEQQLHQQQLIAGLGGPREHDPIPILRASKTGDLHSRSGPVPTTSPTGSLT